MISEFTSFFFSAPRILTYNFRKKSQNSKTKVRINCELELQTSTVSLIKYRLAVLYHILVLQNSFPGQSSSYCSRHMKTGRWWQQHHPIPPRY